MRKKNYIVLLSIFVLPILIVTSFIYYNINIALNSVDKNAGIVVPKTKPDYHFAMICENMEDPFWLSIKKGVEKASKDFNVAVEFNWPSASQADDRWKSLDMAITSKVDGIVTYVWDEKQAVEHINRSVEKGIPVVTIGTDAQTSRRVSFVNVNTYSLGMQLGRMLLAATGDQGDAVVLVSNDQVGGTVVQNLMISGIKNAVKAYPHINLTTLEYNRSNFLSIEDTVKEMLTNMPGLDAILCTSAQDTTAVAQRLIDLNKVGYNIVGYGDSPEILRYIDNGVVFGTVTASHEQMGYNAIAALVELKRKGRTSAYFTVDTHLITKTNVSEFLKPGEE